MRDLYAQSRLSKLSAHSRVIYSTFLLFTLVGVGLTLWLSSEMVGTRLQRFAEYYAGERPAAAEHAAAPALDEGPAFDLPAEMTEQPAPEPMATRKLLEVTHFHIFSMPIYMLILAHIYVLSAASSRSKTVWVGIAITSTAAHIAAPWMGAAGTAGAAVTYALSGTGLFASMTWMAIVPLVEMWIPRRLEAGAGASSSPARAASSTTTL
jgi:hypothetical protein